MYREINDKYICDVIQHYSQKRKDINTKLENMNRFLESQEMKNEAFHSAGYGSHTRELSIDSQKENHDISDTLYLYWKLLREYRTNVCGYVKQLMDELETMQRIMLCYLLLDGKDKEILELYYSGTDNENETFQSKSYSIMQKLHLSYATVKRRRKEALEKLKKMYRSSCSISELINRQSGNKPSD